MAAILQGRSVELATRVAFGSLLNRNKAISGAACHVEGGGGRSREYHQPRVLR